ncbi:MAG: glycosyltransferase family 2 protein [Planctomycetota bacterium]|nr:glycosyltransferase family 2 protein [Planctomycetota bacterium]
MPKVSVIIPLYNKARYIQRTLASILAQTWQDFEVVVVDDGSTDDGPAVIRACDDGRIRLIWQANQGPGAARNHGIRSSTAPYIAFLDADDEWLPDFLERAITTLEEQQKGPVFVTDHFMGISSDTFFQRHPDLPLRSGQSTLPVDARPETVKACVDMFAQGAMVVAREVVSHLGGYLEDGCTYGEDAFLWLRVLLNYPVSVCSEPLLRVHFESSVLGSGRPTPYPVHALVERAARILEECPPRYRDLVEGALDYYALISLWRRMDCRDSAGAKHIMATFPYTRRYWTQFLKARIKLGLLTWIRARNGAQWSLRLRPAGAAGEAASHLKEQASATGSPAPH